MTRIVVYRHERTDGGRRTGIELNSSGIFESFREGSIEHDPALTWYIDLQFEGGSLPDTPKSVRQWLIANSRSIGNTLHGLSHEIVAGFDPEIRPFQRVIENWSSDVTFTASASAVDRVTARSISQEVVDIADDWIDILAQLEPLVSV
jgi:hypothetical protein